MSAAIDLLQRLRVGVRARLVGLVVHPAHPARPGPSRRAGSVRAVGWGVGLFALATAAYSAALETRLPQLRDPEYGYRLV
ncbi:MAG: hypothetical protein K2V38_17445, partial [Gemmataceae bacterium]|nr:hypothetical protein [Gemmataceae bacterium]